MLEVNGSCVYPDNALCGASYNYIVDMEECPLCCDAEGCSSDCVYYSEEKEGEQK